MPRPRHRHKLRFAADGVQHEVQVALPSELAEALRRLGSGAWRLGF